jgi:cytochrome b
MRARRTGLHATRAKTHLARAVAAYVKRIVELPVLVALVAARIIWGFVGLRRARFAAFMKPPADILRYARGALAGKAPRHLGHNPLGGAMAAAMLAALLGVCWLGWLLTTDAHWGVEEYKEIHEAAAYGLFGMVGLHLMGVIWTRASHRENLVKAMFTGRKPA